MIKYWIGVSAAGMMGLLLFQPAYALESRENSEEGVEGASLLSTQPVQLNELEQPYTTVGEWLEAQAESAIAITNIQLNSTATGVEVILETQGQVAPTTSTVGNALIVEIPNAVLSGDRFEQAEPTAGIALITAESLPGNRVRVVITGTEAPPTATVQTGTQSLMVGITPGTTTADVTDTDAINVVVTAEKTPEDPLDVPISLTVLTEDELEDAQINTIREVAANTPNFFASVGDRVFNFYSIRGIGNSNFLIRDSVGFYLDDVPIEYFHQFFPGDLFDIEQVEILRGPQNTLYGRNSIAGVVNITSRPPSEVLETQLGLEYGTYNQRRVQVSLSDTVIPDTLGFRLSGVYSARDGFTENTLLDEDANAQSDIAGRLNLVWTPSEDWTIAFNALGAASNDGGAVYAAIDQDDPFEIEENEIAELDLSVSAQSLRVAYDGDNFRFTSITAHNFSNVGYRSDGDYTAQDCTVQIWR
ncbi:MAG: TonB-dependent receptor plug domain-containing protein [Leptolyngbyaceae cyanobacterium RM2_2_4]|nr:TonB-dependent receptor plug domain-containing protein [Leptolyngbyaceae cyanobacterium RM2_2_4]